MNENALPESDDSGVIMKPTTPTVVVDWNTPDEDWLFARRAGAGGSDIAAILDATRLRSAWSVWAEKTGHPAWRPSEMTLASQLGVWLEPWLIEQAGRFGASATSPSARTYAHPKVPYRMCSPDGIDSDGWLIECKTGGLASKGAVKGWDTGVPIEYELQARWNTHVMDAPGCRVIALVGGYGLIHVELKRDLEIESMMVDTVDEWWNRYVDGDAEPLVNGVDVGALKRWFPVGDKGPVDLGRDGHDIAVRYANALRIERDAVRAKDDAKAELQRIMQDHSTATYEGVAIASWSTLSSGGRRFSIPKAFLESLESEGQ